MIQSIIIILDDEQSAEILSALRFGSRAKKIKVNAKVSRYVDYEALFNEAQRQLDLKDGQIQRAELEIQAMKSTIQQQNESIEAMK